MSGSALAPLWTPPIGESAKLTQWSLYFNHYYECIRYRYRRITATLFYSAFLDSFILYSTGTGAKHDSIKMIFKPSNISKIFYFLDFRSFISRHSLAWYRMVRKVVHLFPELTDLLVSIIMKHRSDDPDPNQCCGFGMFIPDPGSWLLPIPDPGSKNSNKREGRKKICCHNFLCSHNFHKIPNYFSFEVQKKKIWANFQRIIELFTQKIVTKLSKIWVWDPGSGKNLFRIPDPGVKKAPDPRSRIRIRNTDPNQRYGGPWKINICALTLSIAWSIDAGGTATEPSQEGPETETLLSGRKNRFSPMQTLQRLRRPISCGVSHKVGLRFLG